MTKNAISNQKSGALVWWDFEKVLVKPEVMLQVLKKHGMETVISVPDITAASALRKAASSFTDRSNDNAHKAEVVGVYEDGSIEVAILAHKRLTKDRNASKKVMWDQIDSVVFDSNSNDWLYSGVSRAAKRYIASADQKREYLGHDFVRRHVVHRPLGLMGAFPLRRRQGGFYFVPAANADQAETIAAIVNDIPADCLLNVAHITSDDASKQSIGRAARNYLEKGIGDLKQKLAAWKEAQRTPRSDAVNNTLEEFSALADHARLYRDALNLELGDLDAEMKEAVAMAKGIAGVVKKGVPPVYVATVKALAATHEKKVISWEAIKESGLPDQAYGERAAAWWVKDRGAGAADEAGYKVDCGDSSGIRLLPIGVALDSQESELPPEKDGSVESQIKKMNREQLRGAIEAVSGDMPPARTKRADLVSIYKEGLGLSA